MTLDQLGDFLVSESAPWWAVIGAPILTFYLGQRFTSKAADAQRGADETDREKERQANLSGIRAQLQSERDRAREQREGEERIRRRAEGEKAFVAAMEQIASMRVALSMSSLVYLIDSKDPNDATRVDPARPISDASISDLTSAMNQLRLVVDDSDFEIDGLVMELTAYIDNWTVLGDRRISKVNELIPVLVDLTDDVARIHRSWRNNIE